MRPRSVGQGVGQGDVGPDGAGRDQLLGEERVALGAGQDAVDHGRGTGWPATAWRCSASSTRPKGQLDPLQVGEADQLGQQRPQGVAAVQLVGAVAGHQGDPAAPQGPDQEGQQVAGGAVGPVQVLDHQQQRGQLGQADQRRQHPVEQLDPLEAVRRMAAPGRWPARAAAGLGTAAASGAATSASPGRVPRSRKASTKGTYRRPTSPTSMQPPTSTRTPRPSARRRARRAAGSCRRRRRRRSARRPAARARPGRAATRRSSSSARPTKLPAVVEVTPESMAPPPTTGHAALPLEDPAALHLTKGTSASSSRSSRGSPGTATRRPGGRARGADPVLPAEQLGGDHGGRAERRHRGHPVADHVGQLPGVPAVRVDAAVGAVGDPHAGLDRLGEAVALGLGGGLVLGQRLGRPALPRPLGDVVAVVDVGDQVGARSASRSAASSSSSEPCSMERAPAQAALRMPWAPWAWAATWVRGRPPPRPRPPAPPRTARGRPAGSRGRARPRWRSP